MAPMLLSRSWSVALTLAGLLLGSVASGAEGSPVNLLKDRDAWNRLSMKPGPRMKWDKQGALVVSNREANSLGRFAHGRRLPLVGARLRLDVQFQGVPDKQTNGGLLFFGVETPKGETLVIAISPEKDEIQIGETVKKIRPLVEDPYHFDFQCILGRDEFQVLWGGRLIGKTPIEYKTPTGVVAVGISKGSMAVSQLSLTPDALATASATKGREYADISVEISDKTMTRLPSQFPQYFGTHYARTPDMAGIAWRTVRSWGGTHVRITTDEEKRDKSASVRIGPFSGKEVRLSLRDFHSQSRFAKNPPTAETLIPDLIKHHITAIYIVPHPSLKQPFDKDLNYWTVRLIHERWPEAKDCIAWQMGNEVVSAHFDPKGVKQMKPRPPRVGLGGKFHGYDLRWKLNYYLNDYLAPAIEAIERASQDVYGDPKAIKILLGSMNPYNSQNVKFLKTVMASTFDGRLAPTLKGEPVWKHIDVLTVHYMCGASRAIDRLQGYVDDYMKTGKIEGIWITEDHGRGGKGPVTILDRGLRFMGWVARNRMNAGQARLVWWGEGKRAGGSGKKMMAELGRFMKGRPLTFYEKQLSETRLYVLSDSEDAGTNRILVVIIPEKSGYVDLGTLSLKLAPKAAERAWQVKAVQYSALVPPEEVPVELSREKGGLSVALNRRVTEPFAVFLRTK